MPNHVEWRDCSLMGMVVNDSVGHLLVLCVIFANGLLWCEMHCVLLRFKERQLKWIAISSVTFRHHIVSNLIVYNVSSWHSLTLKGKVMLIMVFLYVCTSFKKILFFYLRSGFCKVWTMCKYTTVRRNYLSVQVRTGSFVKRKMCFVCVMSLKLFFGFGGGCFRGTVKADAHIPLSPEGAKTPLEPNNGIYLVTCRYS
jgi:hypothetical protein